MTLQGAILLWLMAQTPSVDDIEGPPERLDRMGVIASAIAVESGGNLTLAAAAMAISKHESHYSELVHRGEKMGDSGKSVCLRMIHQDGLRDIDRWNTLAGSQPDPTRRCVATGLVMWGRFWYCYRRAEPGQRWESIFSAYGTGAGCQIEKTGRDKARTFRAALSFLYRHKPKS